MSEVVPVGWKGHYLKDISDARRGTTYVSNELSEDQYSHPLYINMKSFNVGGGYSLRGDKFYSPAYQKHQLVRDNDLLISNTDVTDSCDILGSPLYLPSDKLKRDTLFSHHVTALSLSENVDVKFLFFLFCLDKNRIKMKRYGRGTTVKMLDMKEIGKLRLAIPPLPEQKKIASILTSVDAVIEKTHSQINKLEDLKKATMNELLTKGIGHTQFKDSPVGRIPVGWEIMPLLDTSIQKGIQTGPFGSQLHAYEYIAKGIPVIMPKDMNPPFLETSSIAYISEKRASSLKKHRVKNGDLLFSRRGDIGRFALVNESNQGWVCGTGCLRVRTNPEIIHPVFLAQYLMQDYPIDWLNQNAVGLTMLNLNTSILGSLPVIIPPLKEQKKIVAILKAIDLYLISCKGTYCKNQFLKKSLMQDLLTGKVRVSV